MGREENVIIFQDTEKKCKSIDSLSAAIKHSTEAQKLILEKKGEIHDLYNRRLPC